MNIVVSENSVQLSGSQLDGVLGCDSTICVMLLILKSARLSPPNPG
jgi:hypothetical protein